MIQQTLSREEILNTVFCNPGTQIRRRKDRNIPNGGGKEVRLMVVGGGCGRTKRIGFGCWRTNEEKLCLI